MLTKVVLSSRRQHFLSEAHVKLELARRAEKHPGFHLALLLPFEEVHIRRYLRNLLKEERTADERYALLKEVEDLLGLSKNPRMLGFIADIPEESLRDAKRERGNITAAGLYELIVNRWLDFEHERSLRRSTLKDRVSRKGLERGMTALAMSMWHARVKGVDVHQITDILAKEMLAQNMSDWDPGVITHLFGSRSLLVRDDEQQFSFVHQSVLEWIVAREAARDVKAKRDSAALECDEFSALMADFFRSMAGDDDAIAWARRKLFEREKGTAAKNAILVLQRLGESVNLVDFAGQDLRGRDFSGVDWRWADLRGANLEGVTLSGANLSGANLEGARLARANLTRANLSDARMSAADLRFAYLMGTSLKNTTELELAKFYRTNLTGALVSEPVAAKLVDALGAPVILQQVNPLCMPAAAPCFCVSFDGSGELVAAGYSDGTIRIFDSTTGALLRILVGHTHQVNSVAWTADGTTLASASDDGKARLWEGGTGQCIRVIEGHTKAVRSVALSPDGKALASGSDDGTVRMWSLTSGDELLRHRPGGTVHNVVFAPDGLILAVTTDRTVIGLWNMVSGRYTTVSTGNEFLNLPKCIAFSPSGTMVAVGMYNNVVRLYDLDSMRLIRTDLPPF